MNKLLHAIKNVVRAVQFNDTYNRYVPALKYQGQWGEVLWVETDRLQETALNYDRQNLKRSIGSVRGGDWDLMREKVCDLRVPRFLKAHFQEGVELRDTPFYNPHIKTAEQAAAVPYHSWDYITAYEYDERMRRIHELHDSMRRDGYQTREQLGGAKWDEIVVKVGRDGDLLFENSVHRLAIAKILEIPRIPVVVSVRHREWMAFKRKLIRYATRPTGLFSREDGLYQKLTHPDLQSIPFKHECEDRMAFMLKHVKSESGAVLDIGTNLGYFCHRFAQRGFECDAAEYDPAIAWFTSRLFEIEKRACQTLVGDVLDPELPGVRERYDVVLALNVFHHFLKQPATTERLKRFLGRTSMREMFFIPHNVGERPMQGAHLNPTNEEFVEFIIEHSCLTRHEFIGDLIEGRKMFHLWQ